MDEGKNKFLFALVGKNISYSFSREYFTNKFKNLGLENYKYINFDIDKIQDLPSKIKEYKSKLRGMNVTIPYKLDVFNFLDKTSQSN